MNFALVPDAQILADRGADKTKANGNGPWTRGRLGGANDHETEAARQKLQR